MATSFSYWVSARRARHTSPMPPRPRQDRSSYAPMRRPCQSSLAASNVLDGRYSVADRSRTASAVACAESKDTTSARSSWSFSQAPSRKVCCAALSSALACSNTSFTRRQRSDVTCGLPLSASSARYQRRDAGATLQQGLGLAHANLNESRTDDLLAPPSLSLAHEMNRAARRGIAHRGIEHAVGRHHRLPGVERPPLCRLCGVQR